MGKFIDFTQLGGMPLSQDRLLFLQEAWNEQCAALAQAGGAGPLVLYGCSYTRTLVTGTTYAYALAAGWLYYNEQLLRVPGNTVDVDESVDAAYIGLDEVENALTYYNGSTPSVIIDTTGAVGAQPIGTADTDELFALSELGVYMSTAVSGSSSISISNINKRSCQVEFGVTPAPSGVTTIFTITFGAALDHVPNVFMQAMNDNALAISGVTGGPKVTGATSGGFSIEVDGSVLTSGYSYEWSLLWD